MKHFRSLQVVLLWLIVLTALAVSSVSSQASFGSMALASFGGGLTPIKGGVSVRFADTALLKSHGTGLATVPMLEAVTLERCNADLEFFEELSKSQTLRRIELNAVECEVDSLKPLAVANRVRHVAVYNCKIGGLPLSNTSKPWFLDTLILSPALGTKFDGKFLGRLPGLEHLSVAGADFKHEDMEVIKSISTLRTLDLSNTSIRSLPIDQLPLSVQVLHCRGLSVSKNAITALSNRLRGLISLDLSGSTVTDESIAALSAMKKLVSLDLSDTAVSDSGILQLRKSLSSCAVIHNSRESSSAKAGDGVGGEGIAEKVKGRREKIHARPAVGGAEVSVSDFASKVGRATKVRSDDSLSLDEKRSKLAEMGTFHCFAQVAVKTVSDYQQQGWGRAPLPQAIKYRIQLLNDCWYDARNGTYADLIFDPRWMKICGKVLTDVTEICGYDDELEEYYVSTSIAEKLKKGDGLVFKIEFTPATEIWAVRIRADLEALVGPRVKSED